MKKNKIPFTVQTPEQSSGFLLWQVTTLWQRHIKKELEEFNITHTQFVLLASTLWFHVRNQEANQALLSNHTKIDPMTTSTVLRTLQKKNLIKRTEHSTDTRAKIITLTASGKQIVQKAVKKVEQVDNDFFKVLHNGTEDFNKKLIVLLKASQIG